LTRRGSCVIHDALAIMLTMTTSGTALSPEERECVEHDVILPAEPIREKVNPPKANSSALLFSRDELHFVGKLIGNSLKEQLQLRVWALAVQAWYAHLVVGATREPVDRIVKCAEEAIREGLSLKRPIWGEECNRRLGFDEDTVLGWIAYVERHNTAVDLPPKPWAFIEAPQFGPL